MGKSLFEILSASVQSEGFTLWGGVDIDVAKQEYEKSFARYADWIAKEHQGRMQYLERGLDRRENLSLVLPGVQSVFSVGLAYFPVRRSSDKSAPKMAAYISGRDYHLTMAEMLERAVKKTAWPGLRYKVCVDTSAVLERSWAALCGLGWIGKNGMLLNPKYGSYLLLGEVLLSEKLDRGPLLHADYCGSCTRCLDGCPTKAFVNPRELDAKKCISYWTLEDRGDFPEIKNQFGTWIAGCDVCQEVCPFNIKWTQAAARPEEISWEGILGETETAYRERTEESALNRVKPLQFQRNVQNAYQNSKGLPNRSE